MSVASRLAKLEKETPAAIDECEAAHRAFWSAYYQWFQEVLAPFPEALAELRKRVAANLCTWESEAPPDTKLWLLSNTAWAALNKFQDAKEVADRAVAQLEKDLRAAWGEGEAPSEESSATPSHGRWEVVEQGDLPADAESPAGRRTEEDRPCLVDDGGEPFFPEGS
jgi:hypothetical protein